MDTQETKALVEEFNVAWVNRDAEALGALLSAHVAWTLPEGLRPSGVEKVEARDEAIAKLIVGPGSATATILKPDTIKRTVQKLVVEGNTAVGFHRMTAELVDGGTYGADYVWRYTCADGKITRLDEYLDTLHAYKQIPDHPLMQGLLDT